MWFYLPKSRANHKKHAFFFPHGEQSNARKKRKWGRYWKIRQDLLLFAMMIVFLKIGHGIVFSMAEDLNWLYNMRLYEQMEKLDVPSFESDNFQDSYSKWLLVPVFVDKEGNCMIRLNKVHRDSLEIYFNEIAIYNQRTVLHFIASKDARMMDVHRVMNAAKSVGLHRFLMYAKPPN